MAEDKFKDEDGWLKCLAIVYAPDRKKLYRLTNAEGLQYETGKASTAEFSSVSASTASGFKNIDILEPQEDPPRLFQIRPGIEDGCRYFWKVKAGTSRFGLDQDKDVGFLTNETCPLFGSNRVFEIFLLNNWYPAVSASNITGSATTPKIHFIGKKFDLAEITDQDEIDAILADPDSYFRLPLGGVTD